MKLGEVVVDAERAATAVQRHLELLAPGDRPAEQAPIEPRGRDRHGGDRDRPPRPLPGADQDRRIGDVQEALVDP